MIVSLILAADEQNVIGKDNTLVWYLPADLKHFKSTTMGKHLIMGRKTFESIGTPLPGRTSVVITRNPEWKKDGVLVAGSIDEAIEICEGEEEVFVVGGAQIYELAMSIADRIYLTRIHHCFEGDTWFSGIDENSWELASEEFHKADEKNQYDYSFLLYRRKK